MFVSAAGRNWLVFIVIFLATAGLYSNTLNIPWYLDDIVNIVDNPAIRDLTTAFSTSTDGSTFRITAFVSFALNYHFSGLNVASYHLVNIIFHAFTGFLVFLLLKRVFGGDVVLSLIAALFFISHPLQTQTVNYIVQRMTGMSGFFLFLALYLFVRAKEALSQGINFTSLKHLGYYVGFFVSAALAVLTKENTAVLPALCLLFEYFFLKPGNESWGHRIFYVFPACLVPIVLGFQIVLLPILTGGGMGSVIAPEDLLNSQQSSSLYYFVTQWSVIWIYIRLLLLPIGQVLDYGYPVTEQLLTIQNILAGFGLVALLYVAFRIRKTRPLWTFGVFWFFLALSIESSVIPLDTVFEHRMYVPLFGFVIILTDVIHRVFREKRFVAVSCIVLLTFSILTLQRNALWADPISFFEHDVKYGYGSYRSIGRLADIYYEKGMKEKSRQTYNQLGEIIEKRSIVNVQPKMLLNLAVAYERLGEFEKAEQLLRLALGSYPEQLSLHYNLGVVLYRQGKLNEAYESFKYATTLSPGDSKSVNNLAHVALYLGRLDEVMDLLSDLYLLNPELAEGLEREVEDYKNSR